MEVKKHINKKVIAKSDANGLFYKFSYLIIILYCVFLAIGMYYHEMWRDELEAFGRMSFSDGFKNWGTEYSFLTYAFFIKVFLVLYNTQAMFQFYHYAIIVTAVILLNKYSPFNLFEKFFLTFSYFLFFEYGIISRYYGFLVLMVFIIIFLLSRKKVNYYLIIIPLIILANHSINSFIFAICIFLFIINNLFGKYENKTLTKNIVISYALVFLCFILFSLIYFTHTLKEKSEFALMGEAPYFMTFRCIWNSFVPLPKFSIHANSWDTNYFDFPVSYMTSYDKSIYVTAQNIFLSVLSLFILVIILIKFSKKPIVFWVFLCNYLLQLIFLHFARFYFIRHQGLLFITFIYSYWLYHFTDGKIYIPILNKIKLDTLSQIKIDWLFKSMIMIFLILQFVSSSYSFYNDYKYKYTLSYDAARYIKDNNLDKDHEIVGANDFSVQAVAVNLKKKMHLPQSKTYDYFWAPFSKDYNPVISSEELFNACTNYTEKQNKKVLLVLNFPLLDSNHQQKDSTMLSQKSSIILLHSFTGDIVLLDEQYWIYEVKKVNDSELADVELYNNRGVAYGNAKQFDKAIEEFEKALKIAPHDVKVLNNLAITYKFMGKTDLAEACFKKARENKKK